VRMAGPGAADWSAPVGGFGGARLGERTRSAILTSC